MSHISLNIEMPKACDVAVGLNAYLGTYLKLQHFQDRPAGNFQISTYMRFFQGTFSTFYIKHLTMEASMYVRL